MINVNYHTEVIMLYDKNPQKGKGKFFQLQSLIIKTVSSLYFN